MNKRPKSSMCDTSCFIFNEYEYIHFLVLLFVVCLYAFLFAYVVCSLVLMKVTEPLIWSLLQI